MPIIGFKNKFKNFKPLEDYLYLIKFDMKYVKPGALVNKVDNISYDVADLRMHIESVFDSFNKDKFYEYDNGVLILSVCKYLVDNIAGIYEIEIDSKNDRDIYKREEIIKYYNDIKGE